MFELTTRAQREAMSKDVAAALMPARTFLWDGDPAGALVALAGATRSLTERWGCLWHPVVA